MKKSIFLAITVALAITMGTSAFADMRTTYTVDATASTFEHAIDFYTPHYGWGYYEDPYVGIDQGQSFSYSHDLNAAPGSLGIPVSNLVTDADLTLGFYSSDGDGYYSYTWYGTEYYAYDNREFVRLGFDGQNLVNIGEMVGDHEVYDEYEAIVDLTSYINDNGILDVEVAVWNYAGTGDIGLCSSTLSGCYEAVQCVPVPGAALLGIFGLGAAGMRLRKRS